MLGGMQSYVLKLYRRVGTAKASKVIDRAHIGATGAAKAIEQARALFATARGTADFAMLFVKDGDVVWISEPEDASRA